MKLAALVLITLLAGCAVNSSTRVAGWPILTVTERYVDRAWMVEQCKRYVAAPLACAEYDLRARTCTIWYDKAYAPKWIVEHERQHCAGYDHVGSTAMQDFLNQYRRSER